MTAEPLPFTATPFRRAAALAAVAFVLIAGAVPVRLAAQAGQEPTLTNPVSVDNLDADGFFDWVGGRRQPIPLRDGPRHVLYTRTTVPEWDGVSFGDTKTPGVRHLCIGFRTPVVVGSVLVRGGGRLSVLKAGAEYPGDPSDKAQWIPGERLIGARVSSAEVEWEGYALWVFPPGTKTRALRFTHDAPPTDRSYAGRLGGAYLLSERLSSIAMQATAMASANDDKAERINNGTNDETWAAWDNGPEGRPRVVTARDPEWVTLVWPRPVAVRGLVALWAGFGAAEAQVYAGPPDRHPREAKETDWRTVRDFPGIDSQYPRSLGVNLLDFGRTYTTRAVRLKIVAATKEGHPHLIGKTKEGRRVWLGELLALSPLNAAGIETAVLPSAETSGRAHPPIPVRFTLAEAGYVTLVIEDKGGRRIRNLVSETYFPAGANVAWWDGMDDLGRDTEAPRHGIYQIPARFVPPGEYRVRGLTRAKIDLRYEFSVYNSGSPAWETEDGTGGWLTNHTPPQAALFLPADRAPGEKPLVYLGSYVSEGGAGLAWVDLEGKKQGGRGWIGGNWTAAPYLARDDGDGRDKDVLMYVGAPWHEDTDPPSARNAQIRLTALTSHGDRPILTYTFKPAFSPNANGDGAWAEQMGGLAVHDGVIAVSLPRHNQVICVDARTGKVTTSFPIDNPRGVAFDAMGRLLVLSGRSLFRLNYPLSAGPANTTTLVSEGLDDPFAVTMDARENILVSDRGRSHQVKVFTKDGRFVRAIGHPGAPAVGPYDPLHMNNPAGLTLDERGYLWVAEADYAPKRVSVWTPDGRLWKAFYGPGQYGGGGTLDPKDKTRFYYNGMEFRLDWKTGGDTLKDVFCRQAPGDKMLPDGFGVGGLPETPIYFGGRQYMTNAFNSNPTNGASIAMLWELREGKARPVAALGRANDWSLLKGESFRSRWPAGIDLNGDAGRNQTLFAWSDLNGDGRAQPDEVTLISGATGGVTVMPDLAFVVSRVDGRTDRFKPVSFTPKGAPVYDPKHGETAADGAQNPVSSGGDQALVHENGWTVLTVAAKPFAPESMGGVFRGKPKWSYPSLWPGLHASHEAPTPDRPGELIGTTRLLGGFVTPRNSDAGPLWCVNGNMGNMYLLSADGLFVATLFRDIRQGKTWSMPTARRGMLLNDISLHDENFWPSIVQTADGGIYLVDGARTSLVRVDGLETIRRLPASEFKVGAKDLAAAQAWQIRNEAERQSRSGIPTLKVAIRNEALPVGSPEAWSAADWAPIDRRGVAANFDSNSKPYDVMGAVTIAGDRLHAAFRTGDPRLLRNSGETANALFKHGGALDVMLGTDPNADAKRGKPVQGDIRLLVTRVNGATRALLYRAVVPGTTAPVTFASPWRAIALDRVDDVSSLVELAEDGKGGYELAIPVRTLGLNPSDGMTIKGDLGILRGNGFQTAQRVYWSNKATGITADVPSEAELTPALWGLWQFRHE